MTTADQQDSHGMEGVELFTGHIGARPAAGPSVFGAPPEGDILDRLDAVTQDDIGSDFFSHGTPAIDDQARAAFRDSLAALDDGILVATQAEPALAPQVLAPVSPVTAGPPTSPPAMPPAAGLPTAQARHDLPPSRLSAAERDFVLHGPRIAAPSPSGGVA